MLGYLVGLKLVWEEQRLQQELRYAEELGDRENATGRKRRKNKKDNLSVVTNMRAKKEAQNKSRKPSTAAENIDADQDNPYREERIKGCRQNSVDKEKPAKELQRGSRLKSWFK